MSSAHRRVVLEVNLGTVRNNFQKIATAVSPCGVMAVLKANAYGLGARAVGEAVAGAGVNRFGVAELDEALDLLDLGVPVQILGSVLAEEIPEAVACGIVLPIPDRETGQRISDACVRQSRQALCHVKIDTGMGRLGFPADGDADVRFVGSLPGLVLEGVFTHFPMAYRRGSAVTEAQIESFLAMLGRLDSAGMGFRLRHAANSDAINNVGRVYREPFNMVRTGINLYGCFDTEGARAVDVRSVLTLRTRLMAVRELPAGATVGYGCTFQTPARMRVGTISAGYADGLPLALSNRGRVLIGGRVCPVVGRISMDYTTVDLSQAPDARSGDVVTCIGTDGDDQVNIDEWAAIKGTHAYDIICSIGGRVERRYRSV